jgi:hypothetical protein
MLSTTATGTTILIMTAMAVVAVVVTAVVGVVTMAARAKCLASLSLAEALLGFDPTDSQEILIPKCAM